MIRQKQCRHSLQRQEMAETIGLIKPGPGSYSQGEPASPRKVVQGAAHSARLLPERGQSLAPFRLGRYLGQQPGAPGEDDGMGKGQPVGQLIRREPGERYLVRPPPPGIEDLPPERPPLFDRPEQMGSTQPPGRHRRGDELLRLFKRSQSLRSCSKPALKAGLVDCLGPDPGLPSEGEEEPAPLVKRSEA